MIGHGTTGKNGHVATDAAGNVTKIPRLERDRTILGHRNCVYDAWNRLVKVQTDAATPADIAVMTYDGLGRRIIKAITNSGDWDATYHYYYDGHRMIETRNDSDLVLKQHVWGTTYVDELVEIGINDDPSDESEGPSSNQCLCETFYYALQDGNFNVLAIVASDGDVKERYEYTPYGQRTVYKSAGSNDPLVSAPLLESQRVQVSSVDQPYGLCDVGHQGLFHDKETGLIHNRARTLHPTLGRFLQRDPLGYVDGMSLYEYLASGPLDGLDALGLQVDKGEIIAGQGIPPLPRRSDKKYRDIERTRGAVVAGRQWYEDVRAHPDRLKREGHINNEKWWRQHLALQARHRKEEDKKIDSAQGQKILWAAIKWAKDAREPDGRLKQDAVDQALEASKAHHLKSHSAKEFYDGLAKIYNDCMARSKKPARRLRHCECCIRKLTRDGHGTAGFGGREWGWHLDQYINRNKKTPVEDMLCEGALISDTGCWSFRRDIRMYEMHFKLAMFLTKHGGFYEGNRGGSAGILPHSYEPPLDEPVPTRVTIPKGTSTTAVRATFDKIGSGPL